MHATRFGGGYFLQREHFYYAIACYRQRPASTGESSCEAVSTKLSSARFMKEWRNTIRAIDDLCRATQPPPAALRHARKRAHNKRGK